MSELLEFPQRNTLADAVAANIRAEAARAGIRQRELAKRMGMSQAAVSDRYTGRTPWTLEEVETATRVFGVTVSDLVRLKGFEPPTFWLGAGAEVIDLASRRAVA